MDGVKAAARYREGGSSTQLLDGELRSAGQHVGQAVTSRRVAVTVGRGRQGRCVAPQADIGATAQGTRVRVGHVEGCTSHIEARADVVRCQQGQHITTGGRAGHHHAQVQIAREHEGVDGVQAAARHREGGSSTELFDHQVAAGGQHVSQAVTSRRVAVTVRGGRQNLSDRGQTHITATVEGAGVGAGYVERGTCHVQGSADRTATLDQ